MTPRSVMLAFEVWTDAPLAVLRTLHLRLPTRALGRRHVLRQEEQPRVKEETIMEKRQRATVQTCYGTSIVVDSYKDHTHEGHLVRFYNANDQVIVEVSREAFISVVIEDAAGEGA
jgi:hypothetical protein